MMRRTSTSDVQRPRLPVALLVVTVTLGLLAASCSAPNASTETRLDIGSRLECRIRRDQFDRYGGRVATSR